MTLSKDLVHDNKGDKDSIVGLGLDLSKGNDENDELKNEKNNNDGQDLTKVEKKEGIETNDKFEKDKKGDKNLENKEKLNGKKGLDKSEDDNSKTMNDLKNKFESIGKDKSTSETLFENSKNTKNSKNNDKVKPLNKKGKNVGNGVEKSTKNVDNKVDNIDKSVNETNEENKEKLTNNEDNVKNNIKNALKTDLTANKFKSTEKPKNGNKVDNIFKNNIKNNSKTMEKKFESKIKNNNDKIQNKNLSKNSKAKDDDLQKNKQQNKSFNSNNEPDREEETDLTINGGTVRNSSAKEKFDSKNKNSTLSDDHQESIKENNKTENINGAIDDSPTNSANGLGGFESSTSVASTDGTSFFSKETSSSSGNEKSDEGLNSQHKRPSNLSQQSTDSLNDFQQSGKYELLLNRVVENNEELHRRDKFEQETYLEGSQELRKEFEEKKSAYIKKQKFNGILGSADEEINWDFWSNIVSDYTSVAKHKPAELALAISKGLPSCIRGIIWQLMASSKSSILEGIYKDIVNETSIHEKAIRRDLSRTSFARHASMDSLFNVIKAYSLFDPEVGYTQGMAFIIVPLLINLKEEEAFCLLVTLMKSYNLRQLFKNDMPELHLKLYQFERLLEDDVHLVYAHLRRLGVKSSMYASQWFLTLFAYKFPLQIVVRIFDIIISEGLEATLRFSVALMKRNADTILSLEFDQLVKFLKERIFDVYLSPSTNTTPLASVTSLIRINSNETKYDVSQLVYDAYSINLSPKTLDKYKKEFEEAHILENENAEEIETIRNINSSLLNKITYLEESYAITSKEHQAITNSLIEGNLERARLKDENEALQIENQELKKLLDMREQPIYLDDQLKEQMERLMERNTEVMLLNQSLEDSLAGREAELAEAKLRIATLNDTNETLNQIITQLSK